MRWRKPSENLWNHKTWWLILDIRCHISGQRRRIPPIRTCRPPPASNKRANIFTLNIQSGQVVQARTYIRKHKRRSPQIPHPHIHTHRKRNLNRTQQCLQITKLPFKVRHSDTHTSAFVSHIAHLHAYSMGVCVCFFFLLWAGRQDEKRMLYCCRWKKGTHIEEDPVGVERTSSKVSNEVAHQRKQKYNAINPTPKCKLNLRACDVKTNELLIIISFKKLLEIQCTSFKVEHSTKILTTKNPSNG